MTDTAVPYKQKTITKCRGCSSKRSVVDARKIEGVFMVGVECLECHRKGEIARHEDFQIAYGAAITNWNIGLEQDNGNLL